MKKHCFLLCLVFVLGIAVSKAQTEKFSFDKGWRFYQGDIPMPLVTGHSMSYNNAKAGTALGAASPGFDDTEWRLLSLPHDWSVEQPFDSTENLSQGYRKRGMGWYRRNFKLDTKDRGKHIEIQFDGVATNATVWCNGTVVHRNFCGYTSFYIDITEFAKYGEELNNIAIKVDAVQQEGWWYEGAGIYRHTWLVKRNPVHVITDGVYANPIKQNGSQWLIPVEATIQNIGKTNSNVEVEATLYDNKGNAVTKNTTSVSVNSLHQGIAKLPLQVNAPQLWWINQPILYNVKTVVKQNGNIVDEVNTSCGFRTIKFTTDSGFYLNDTYVKIKGTCNHQDHAGVGVAVPASIWEFRIKKLKEMGSNAFRCAHNPPSKEFLDACDKMGLLVMDENRNFNSSADYIPQLEWLIKRDRNHPSVILWSVFNEETSQGTEMGNEMVRRMSAIVKNYDTTRPVTAAMSGGFFTPINVSTAVDVLGFNYNNASYDKFHAAHPTIPMTSSEDVSAFMQRDVYVTDAAKRLLASYDNDRASWGSTHRSSWKMVNERRYLGGCFVWTGFDYRGEPTPYTWPTAGSNFGIMDACGFPKAAFYFYQAQWLENKTVLQIVPHWNWPKDSIGKKIQVMAFSNVEKIKLLLNGKLIGEQIVDKYEMNSWYVAYQPGKLEAIGYIKGKEVARSKVETTGAPVSLQLVADRNSIAGDGWDAVPVTVQAIDAKGRVVRTANIPVTFEVSGEGTMIGHGNGDPNSHELEKGNTRSLYNGLAQAIMQSKTKGNGQLILTAKSAGLQSATVTITVKDSTPIPSVATVNKDFTIGNNWRLSPYTYTKPDVNQDILDNDMNSWTSVKPNLLQDFSNGRFVMYRNTFKPYAATQNKGGQLILKSVTGKAEVWIDKKLVATKTAMAAEDIVVELPPVKGERKMSILIEAEQGSKAGLGGLVLIKAKE